MYILCTNKNKVLAFTSHMSQYFTTTRIKHPTLVAGKYVYKSPYCFKNVKRLPIKYEANTNSWMATKTFEYNLTHLVRELSAKNCKILTFH